MENRSRYKRTDQTASSTSGAYKNYHHTYVKFNSSFIDGIFVYRQGSQNKFHMFRSIYPLHFDVKDIHIRIHIIFHENFTQKTIYTASIYILQGNSTAAATVGNMMSIACQLLLMRARARRAYCKKCRVHIALERVGRSKF